MKNKDWKHNYMRYYILGPPEKEEYTQILKKDKRATK